jgi:predicted HNH restriction endonuclease
MVKSSVDLFNGINNFLNGQKASQLTLSGVTVHPREKDGDYFCCYINKRKYWLEFSKRRRNKQSKSFIHLYDENKTEHSVVQLTIDKSNFSIESGKFLLIQNRGTTIGRKIEGLEAEFKALMHKLGFSEKDVITSGDCKKPNYKSTIEEILFWLRLRVRAKLTLEEKYRGIEDRSSENEAEVDFDDIKDIESKTEGGKKVIISLQAERDPALRSAAIQIHGLKCKACGFDFHKKYGVLGKGYIEVHHVIPLSLKNSRKTNPATDLTVVCANCHRMIHRKKRTTLSITELKAKLK